MTSPAISPGDRLRNCAYIQLDSIRHTRGHGMIPAHRRPTDPFAAHPLSVSAAIAYEIYEFLVWEALLLDSHRYPEWSALLGKDLAYRCPGKPDAERSYNMTLWHLRKQLAVATAASAHTHRFLSNVLVTYGDCPEEFVVSSYILINYSHSGESDTKSFSVDRRDHLRRASNSFQIMRREVRMGHVAPEVRELVGPL
jgi:3-phenylpropionate/cinnamic acid dioxygenase small subunit